MNLYQLDTRLMLNQTANPENQKYHTDITGTTNLRTVMQAPVIATKGHFYQLIPVVSHTKAKIYDRNGTLMTPKVERDDTTIGVEEITGVTMIAKQRL